MLTIEVQLKFQFIKPLNINSISKFQFLLKEKKVPHPIKLPHPTPLKYIKKGLKELYIIL